MAFAYSYFLIANIYAVDSHRIMPHATEYSFSWTRENGDPHVATNKTCRVQRPPYQNKGLTNMTQLRQPTVGL
jgi:hypothetical protein